MIGRAAALGLTALTVSSCAFTGIDILRDERIAMVAPAEGDTVSVPFTVSWRWNEQVAPGRAVSYAVFVDRTAMKPGETVKAIVPESDRNCRQDAACPDAAYLARQGVYVVTEPQVSIPQVKVSTEEKRSQHRVTVVILVDGRRDGEGAFSRIVYVPGEAS